MTVLSPSQTVSTASALEIKDLSSQHVKHTLCIPTTIDPSHPKRTGSKRESKVVSFYEGDFKTNAHVGNTA